MCSSCVLWPSNFISVFCLIERLLNCLSFVLFCLFFCFIFFHRNTAYLTRWLVLIHDLGQRLHLSNTVMLLLLEKETLTEKKQEEVRERNRCSLTEQADLTNILFEFTSLKGTWKQINAHNSYSVQVVTYNWNTHSWLQMDTWNPNGLVQILKENDKTNSIYFEFFHYSCF